VGVAGLVGAFGFGASLDRLVDQPARWGANYDVAVGGNGASSIPKNIVAAVKRNTTATGITFYGTGQTRVGRTSLQLAGMQPVRGDLLPPVLEGRNPTGPNELALGRLTARELHTRVGGRLRLTSKGRVTQFRVTGIVVVPGVDGVDGVGLDGVVTLDSLAALRGIDVSKAADSVVVSAPSGSTFVRRLALFRSLGGDLSSVSKAQQDKKSLIFDPPTSVTNIDRIRGVPYLLGGVLALLVLFTMLHAVTTSVHRRRRDVAVLRALGSGRRWIVGAQCWQAVAVVAGPIALGIPVGLLAGTRVFHLFADSIGTVDAATASVPVTAAIGLGTLALAVLAAVATRGGRRGSPSQVLRSE
jgi:ABC-type antimicrobial peptide transport system permease subunit